MHTAFPIIGRGSNIQIRASTMSTRTRCIPIACVRLARCSRGIRQGVSTTSNVLDPKIHSLIIQGAEILQRSSALQALLEDQEVDLVLDVRHHTGATRTSYYCVSHAERRVFWLEGIGHEEVDIPCTSNKCTQFKGSGVHCSWISSGLVFMWLTLSKVSRPNTGELVRVGQ